MFKAFYWRYMHVCVDAFDTLQEAKDFLADGRDAGSMSHIGALDVTNDTFYLWNILEAKKRSRRSG